MVANENVIEQVTSPLSLNIIAPTIYTTLFLTTGVKSMGVLGCTPLAAAASYWSVRLKSQNSCSSSKGLPSSSNRSCSCNITRILLKLNST